MPNYELVQSLGVFTAGSRAAIFTTKLLSMRVGKLIFLPCRKHILSSVYVFQDC